MPRRGPSSELPAGDLDRAVFVRDLGGTRHVFVGWDWATETHDVTVIDDAGTRIDRWELPHTEKGLTTTLARLAAHGAPADLPVAIESSRGLVVDRLLAAGHTVVPVHPNAFHAVRPRWGASKAKTDAGDSFKLADYLRTDAHQLRTLVATGAPTLELQALTRTREDLVGQRVAATNHLAALLAEHWPGAGAVFSRLDTAIALDFLDRYPTWQSAAKLTPAKMRDFCARHGYSGRRTGAELVERMRLAVHSATRLSQDVVTSLVHAQVTVIRAIKAAITDLEAQITKAVTAHPWAPLIATMPRIGTVNLAQIIGEVGPMLERATNADQLAAEAGVVPVTRASGKSRAVVFRYATNHAARQAITTFADNSRRSSPWAATIYDQARATGKRHPHAVRILARAWLRIIYACWRDGVCYDPTTHETKNKTGTIDTLAA